MRLRNNPKALPEIKMHPDKVIIFNKGDKAINWKDVFKNDNDLSIEIGCGKGDFIIQMAKHFPEQNFVAIEIYPTVLHYALKKIIDEPIPNLRFLMCDARNLEEIFQPQSLKQVFLNFSDPWPKARHAKRRLTSPDFLKMYQNIARENLEFKTDNEGLFDYSLETLQEEGFELLFNERNLHQYLKNNDVLNFMTEYESKFHQKGNPIFKLIAKL